MKASWDGSNSERDAGGLCEFWEEVEDLRLLFISRSNSALLCGLELAIAVAGIVQVLVTVIS